MTGVPGACEAARRMVASSGSEKDLEYFELHLPRFRATAARLLEIVPVGSTILDVGSHFLHQATILRLLGYRVSAMDVPAFATLSLVADRGRRMEIANHPVEPEHFATGQFLRDVPEQYDAILFCEILEHVTFNPIDFWRRIHELLRVGGIIYVTTPNSLRLIALMGAFWNLVSLSRIGISVPQIFRHVTFGHHWKEYSARELKQYFHALSDDFAVSVRKIHYGPVPESIRKQIGPVRSLLLSLGNATGVFADNLEAVVSLRRRSAWTLIPPGVA